MIGKPRRDSRTLLFVTSAFVLLGGLIASLPRAEALLVSEEEHWKYNMHWIWKSSIRKNVGIIDSQIIVENETADRIEGYIADANGVRLTVYDDEQVVMVKYEYDDPFAAGSDWEIADRTQDGFFTVQIPEKYRDAEIIGLYIGSNSYWVDNGEFPRPYVLVNPVRMDYRTNSTLILEEPQTIIAAQDNGKPSAWQTYSEDSLIDRILRESSVRSSNPGK